MEFIINADPLPQPRPRFSRGRVYQPADITRYKECIKQKAMELANIPAPLEGKLKCTLKFFRRFKNTSRRYGDLDNLAKGILDALNKIIYADDAQIVSLTAEKYQSDVPRIEISISEVSEV